MKKADKLRAQIKEKFENKANKAKDYTEHPIDAIPEERIRLFIKNINVDLIDPNPYQPRRVFNDIEELANSIKVKGLLQPIIISKNGDRYSLTAGERRWRACKLLGEKTIPSIIKDDLDKADAALIENTNRDDLSAAELALAIKDHVENKGKSQKEIALLISKTEAQVSQGMKIASFISLYNERYGKDSFFHLRDGDNNSPGWRHLLFAASQPSFEEGVVLLKEIIQGSLTVKTVQQKIKEKGTARVKPWNAIRIVNHLENINKSLCFDSFISAALKDKERDRVMQAIDNTLEKLHVGIADLEKAKEQFETVEVRADKNNNFLQAG